MVKIGSLKKYPPTFFYEPIIRNTLTKIVVPEPKKAETNKDSTISNHKIYLEFRGKATDDFVRELHRLNAPVTAIIKLRKIRSILPSFKELPYFNNLHIQTINILFMKQYLNSEINK